MYQENHELSTPLLEQIGNPEDLRRLEPSQLGQVCSEIRQTLIHDLSVNPGHFGSSMGAVDIIVALHYVFNTPRDRIVFDVGHQHMPINCSQVVAKPLPPKGLWEGSAVSRLLRKANMTLSPAAMPETPFPRLWGWPSPI